MSNGGSAKKSSRQGNSCHLLNVKNPTRAAVRLKLSFQRVDAKLHVLKAGKEYDVGLTLLDVSEAGVGLYSSHMLAKGASVELNIFEPKILKVRGVVAWCVPAQSQLNSLVVRYPYRCGVQFIFDSEVQRFAVLEFMQKIREKSNNMSVPPPIPAGSPGPAFGENTGVIEVTPAVVSPPAATENAPIPETAPAPAGEATPPPAAPDVAAVAPAAEAAPVSTPAAEEAAPIDEKKAA